MSENTPATFFVATDGDDSWSGKLPAPNTEKTGGPFATLHRARDALRELKKQAADGLQDPLTVLVRGGESTISSGRLILLKQTAELPRRR